MAKDRRGGVASTRCDGRVHGCPEANWARHRGWCDSLRPKVKPSVGTNRADRLVPLEVSGPWLLCITADSICQPKTTLHSCAGPEVHIVLGYSGTSRKFQLYYFTLPASLDIITKFFPFPLLASQVCCALILFTARKIPSVPAYSSNRPSLPFNPFLSSNVPYCLILLLLAPIISIEIQPTTWNMLTAATIASAAQL